MSEGRKIMQVRSARQVPVRVQLLDDEILDLTVDKRAVGWILFDKVCEHLNVLEKDYFGLNFINPEGVKYWLDNEKKITKQMKGLVSWNLCFEVKFYPSDPIQMAEDLTRYLLCLQIRRDVVNERVPCSTVTYALLGSFTAQSELGDYEPEDFGSGTSYLKDIQFAPHQDKNLLSQIAKLHRTHKGLTPEEAEMKFLENAKKSELYGVELHSVKDAEGKEISLGVCASGILIYKDTQQVNRFVWPKILKMSYRRNKFYIKIRPGEFETFESLIGFRLTSVKMAKRLWKICVEHHSFFRFKEPEPVKSLSVIPRFGSRFRYSGRTQYQSRQIVAEEARDAPYFDRVLSKRGTFGGRTTNMRQRDEERKRQRDEMRRAPPPSMPQESKPPPQPKKQKENHEDRNGTPPEPRRTPPEPRHAPPVAPKPKPNIAPKPKPSPRGDNASLDRGSRGSLNDSFEDIPDRRSKMEKMNAVMTPLAAVMQKSLEKHKHPEEESEDEDRDRHSDRHSDHDHPDDGYEVGIRADRARTRSELTHTDKRCRSNDTFLFSYPSSSVDSILSNDFDDYETDRNYSKSKLKHKVASDEHLNSSDETSMKKSSRKSHNYGGLSQSAESVLSDPHFSHYSEIDSTPTEGIYAEIEEVKTSTPANKSNPLTHNQKKDSGIIHGRRSRLFKPNQKQNKAKSNKDDQNLTPSKPFESIAIDTSLKPTDNLISKAGTTPQSQVPFYSQVNKKNRKTTEALKLSPIPKVPDKISEQENKSNTKVSPEPYYDTIQDIKQTAHKRQDSQASLKEELKMYIITPEKLRQNSSSSRSQYPEEITYKTHEQNLDASVGKAASKYSNSDKNVGQHYTQSNLERTDKDELYMNTNMCTIEDKTPELDRDVTVKEFPGKVDKESNDVENGQEKRNIVVDQYNKPFELKQDILSTVQDNTNKDASKANIANDDEGCLGPVKGRSITSLYQLTFDSCNNHSPESPKDVSGKFEASAEVNFIQPYDSENLLDLSTSLSCISIDSEKKRSHSHASIPDAESKLEESLELFCGLSSDSSDLEIEPYTFKQKGSKRSTGSERKKNTMDKEEQLKKATVDRCNDESELHTDILLDPTQDKSKSIDKPTKPKTVLKKVTSLVKKIPVLSSTKDTSKKEEFVCEEFEREPFRRRPGIHRDNETKPLSDSETLNSSTSSPCSKLETSNLLPNNESETNKRTDNGSHLMDFFVKPQSLEDFHNNETTAQSSIQSESVANVSISASHELSFSEDKSEAELPSVSNTGKEIPNEQISENSEEKPNEQDDFKTKDREINTLYENDSENRDNLQNSVKLNEKPLSTTGVSSHIQSNSVKSKDPYWYKTHLLPSKYENSEVTESVGKNYSDLKEIDETNYNKGQNLTSTGEGKIDKNESKEKADKIESKEKDNNEKSLKHIGTKSEDVNKKCRNENKTESVRLDKQGKQKSSQISTKSKQDVIPINFVIPANLQLRTGGPTVIGSKVYKEEAIADESVECVNQEPNNIDTPALKSKSSSVAGNIGRYKPIYKLDYSSGSSSSLSSLHTYPSVSDNSYAKDKIKRKAISTESSDKSSKIKKKKISPGVVHMVRPSPAGWIEGGLSSSFTKEQRKPKETERFVSVLDTEIPPEVSIPTGTVSDLNFEVGTDSGNAEIEFEEDESVEEGTINESFLTSGEQIEEKSVIENQSDKNTNTEIAGSNGTSFSGIQSVPKAELLCKRVWKYPKDKKDLKLRRDGTDVDEFTKAIEQGPDDGPDLEIFPGTNETDKLADLNKEIAENESEGVIIDDPSFTQIKHSKPDNKITDKAQLKSQSNLHDTSNDLIEHIDLKTEHHLTSGDQTNNTITFEKSEQLEEVSPEKDTNLLQASDQSLILETDTVTIETDQEHNEKNVNDETNELISSSTIDFQSKTGRTLVDDVSSENSSFDDSSSEDEIISFEMPKPSLNSINQAPEELDIPFADEDDDGQMKGDFPELSGFAIDCSFEDVTSYKMSDTKENSRGKASARDNFFASMMAVTDDRYDVNYWDEDIGFDDYDDSFGEQEYDLNVPEVIDDSPYITKRSNLKNTLTQETTFSDRRVHFPDVLPFYKSKRNIQQHDQQSQKVNFMNKCNEDQSKIDHLEKFIVGLFDEEPRNIGIPRSYLNTSSTDPTVSSQNLSNNSQDFGKPSVVNNDLGFHSALTFEDVNFSLSPLECYTLEEKNNRNNVITTDLDDIDYHDEWYQPLVAGTESEVSIGNTNKYDKKSSAKIVKPVSGRKRKHSNEDVSEQHNGNTGFDNDEAVLPANNVTLDHYQDDVKDNYDQHQSVSPFESNIERPIYTSQCSAELLTDSNMTDASSPVLSSQSESCPYQHHLNQQECTCLETFNSYEHNKIDTGRYVDVSELTKKEKERDSDKIILDDRPETKEVISTPTQPSNASSDRITKYSYCYADDSDPESPKIKYVTYEYVTEYKLNNVKIQYQHNKKVQTDSKLLENQVSNDSGKSNPNKLISTESQTDKAMGTAIKSVGNDAMSVTGGFGEVLEEVVEPHIRRSICTPLGKEEGCNESTEIEVEEIIEPSVCFPLGRIEGLPSVHPIKLPDIVVEEHVEKSVCHTLGKKTDSEQSKTQPDIVCYNLRDKSSHHGVADNTTDDNKEQNKSLNSQVSLSKAEARLGQSAASNVKEVSKQDDRKGFGKGYTEKQVLEYNSEKYLFQCYQPTLYSQNRFPQFLPGRFQEKGVKLWQESERDKYTPKLDIDKKGKEVNVMETEAKQNLTDNSFKLEVLETSKELQDSGYETFLEDQITGNETDVEDQFAESVVTDNEYLYSTIMQEQLPDLRIEDSTHDRIFVVQAMAVLALGAVLTFMLPFMG